MLFNTLLKLLWHDDAVKARKTMKARRRIFIKRAKIGHLYGRTTQITIGAVKKLIKKLHPEERDAIYNILIIKGQWVTVLKIYFLRRLGCGAGTVFGPSSPSFAARISTVSQSPPSSPYLKIRRSPLTPSFSIR